MSTIPQRTKRDDDDGGDGDGDDVVKILLELKQQFLAITNTI